MNKKLKITLAIVLALGIITAGIIFAVSRNAKPDNVQTIKKAEDTLYDSELGQFRLGNFFFGNNWRYVCEELGLDSDIEEYDSGYMIGGDAINLEGTGSITGDELEVLGHTAMIKYHFFKGMLTGVSYELNKSQLTPELAQELSDALLEQFDGLEKKTRGSLDSLKDQAYEIVWQSASEEQPNQLTFHVMEDFDGGVRIGIFAGFDIYDLDDSGNDDNEEPVSEENAEDEIQPEEPASAE